MGSLGSNFFCYDRILKRFPGSARHRGGGNGPTVGRRRGVWVGYEALMCTRAGHRRRTHVLYLFVLWHKVYSNCLDAETSPHQQVSLKTKKLIDFYSKLKI
jgi:hypothetical protein